ncbi:MAG: hypothetical protein KBD31_02965 [Proteobacteria bacterium]|nr:hypothetical protein [Pseudomonadota bacterium]
MIDFFVNFIFLNIHTLLSFNFNLSNARFLHFEESGFLFFHSLLSSCITGAYVTIITMLEKRKLYQVKMIRSFRNEKRYSFKETNRDPYF